MIRRQFAPPRPTAPPRAGPDEKIILSEHEKNVILALTQELRQSDHGKTWGPRAIKAFMFRYQLARALLMKLNHAPFRLSPRHLPCCGDGPRRLR